MLVRYEHDGSMVPVLKEREENILRKEMLEDNLVSVSCIWPEAAFSNSLPFKMQSMLLGNGWKFRIPVLPYPLEIRIYI